MTIEFFFEVMKFYGPFYGPLMGVIIFLIWTHIINPIRKKRKGTFVTWRSMEEKQKEYVKETKEAKLESQRLGSALEIVEAKIDAHILGQVEKEIAMRSLQARVESTESRYTEVGFIVRDLAENLKTNNRLMGLVKDFLEKKSGGL